MVACNRNAISPNRKPQNSSPEAFRPHFHVWRAPRGNGNGRKMQPPTTPESKTFRPFPTRNRMLKFYIINNFNLYTLSYFRYIKTPPPPPTLPPSRGQFNLVGKIARFFHGGFSSSLDDGRLRFPLVSHKTNDNFFPLT